MSTVAGEDERKSGDAAVPAKAPVNADGSTPLVLVTGVSGYIGAHIAQQLLRAGYRVRGTTRSLKNTTKVTALRGLCPEAKHPIELVELDLLDADSWTSAVKGCTYVQHIASPFIIGKIDEALMLRTAIEGTLTVLKACAATPSVKRVIFTSSVVSVDSGHDYVPDRVYTEKDWSVPEKCTSYPKSKVLAERAAWDFHSKLPEETRFDLACVNPSFVFGPPLLKQGGASIEHISGFFNGKFPMVPDIRYSVVDVRDVARCHILAMESAKSNGNRYLCSSDATGMRPVARLLQAQFGKYGYGIPTRNLPKAVMWLASWFDAGAAAGLSNFGKQWFYSNAKAKAELGMTFRPITDTIVEMGYALIRLGIVEDKSEAGRLSSGAAPSPVRAQIGRA